MEDTTSERISRGKTEDTLSRISPPKSSAEQRMVEALIHWANVYGQMMSGHNYYAGSMTRALQRVKKALEEEPNVAWDLVKEKIKEEQEAIREYGVENYGYSFFYYRSLGTGSVAQSESFYHTFLLYIFFGRSREGLKTLMTDVRKHKHVWKRDVKARLQRERL